MEVFSPGTIIKKRYVVQKKIGHGGTANVYLVKDEITDKYLALKIMKSQEDSKIGQSLKRFKEEAKVLEQLDSENIVKIYNAFFEEDSKFIAMEFVDGHTLTQLVKRNGSYSNKEACKIILQVLNGLSEIHKKNIIHRDIKPGNILVSHDGKIKITDFGIVKTQESEDLTKTGSVVGSVHYISPEIIKGSKPTIQLDVYSTGALLYYLLAATTPFTGNTPVEIIKKKVTGEAKEINRYNENVDEKLNAIIQTAMSRDIEKRYKNVTEFKAEIINYLNNDNLQYTTTLKKTKVKKNDFKDFETILKEAEKKGEENKKFELTKPFIFLIIGVLTIFILIITVILLVVLL